ncbi:hypothetical protein CAPTEDRAFT_177539 [Capitella teleta]|uniref:Paired amphipathic helix protein Sin3a n=1 Tax=Capitella teleta TaxID=283909 RepID=R7T4U3_CAPTE|nr:hypothetical protein CAPTEDRAFT_177539 [Capitella teleta]|eukprot:ELT88117.1 hypothetical protein CAPTEDRAFT_177539 [Capitella teleta]
MAQQAQPPPASAPPANPISQGQQQQQQFQRLKVEDALSYLDQVKLQFGNQPQVYNDFLDIMKEFKSQSIDTPGVINRVSNLFRGHPDLIVGFNTFLPPGYKIEVQNNETISLIQPGQEVISLSTGAAPLKPTNTNTPSGPGAGTGGASGASGHHSYHQPSRPNLEALAGLQHQGQAQQAGQPVEFNHAINYVNKIKNRFQGQPDIYKSFLEILHTYQKEQRNIKEGMLSPSCKPLTETEVYSQVAKLFQNQEDLLSEFGQFLPDANGGLGLPLSSLTNADSALGGMRNDHSSTVKKPGFGAKGAATKSGQVRRPAGPSNAQPPSKKLKPSVLKDITLAEAGKYGSLNEYAYFDKVRKALRNENVYRNFLRCLVLFNQEVVSRSELIQLVNPFLGKHPELMKGLKDLLGHKESAITDSVPQSVGKERISGEFAMEIDYSSCRRYGASYRALPKTYPQPRCTGRSPLCKEVLNDTWVSFPSWSEESTGSSKKTQYEEHIYRCEDERFELDIVIEANASTIRILEAVQKKLNRMQAEDAAKFRLDNSLGGNSEVLHRKNISRIYGDKSQDIIDGLKKNPLVAVPLVLRRLKGKEDEWRDAQRSFNKVWREQNQKYYLKSLDHQGINFKQNDIKQIRSKALLNEIEAVFDERQEQASHHTDNSSQVETGPHLSYVYKDRSVIDDITSLVVHHLKRQSSIQKEDKHKMKVLMHHFLPMLFHLPPNELSDDEPQADDDSDLEEGTRIEAIKDDPDRSCTPVKKETEATETTTSPIKENEIKKEVDDLVNGASSDGESDQPGDRYHIIFVNNNWYIFLRLHNLLSERLSKIHRQAQIFAEEENLSKKERKESTAIALRLKTPSQVEPEEYYNFFLDKVKELLDGNIEPSSYEDTCREMFSIHAYIAFTLDKIVQNMVRQLQHLVADDICIQVKDLFEKEALNGATGGCVATAHRRQAKELAYQRKAEQIMSDENCFKISFNKDDCRLSFELLDTEGESPEEVNNTEQWASFVDQYIETENENQPASTCPAASASDLPTDEATGEPGEFKPVYLPRNVRIRKQVLSPDQRVLSESLLRLHENQNQNRQRPSDSDEEDDGVDILENTQCKFNVNSFRMVYVVNSESFLYKRNSLKAAKENHRKLSLVKHEKFARFCDQWAKRNVNHAQEDACDNWFMGNLDSLRPSNIYIKDFNDLSQPPYYPLKKYKEQVSKRPEAMDTSS